MCTWYNQIFSEYPLKPSVTLKKVTFVETWAGYDWVNYGDEVLSGLFVFDESYERTDEIFILWPSLKNEFWIHNDELLESILAHEIFHYFKKSCCWDKIEKIDYMNMALFESSAYWSQDQYLKRNHKKSVMDFIANPETDTWHIINYFESVSMTAYQMNKRLYMFNAINWFDNDPVRIYDGLINGHYLFSRY
ncbi:MAG: hypothetical protein OXM55_08445 [Bdellovibrionales bacterium]|nr:hypothetical protein [Bdellovibrionales bacterium]